MPQQMSSLPTVRPSLPPSVVGVSWLVKLGWLVVYLEDGLPVDGSVVDDHGEVFFASYGLDENDQSSKLGQLDTNCNKLHSWQEPADDEDDVDVDVHDVVDVEDDHFDRFSL